MPEHHEKSGQDESSADPKKEANCKHSLFGALLCAGHEIEFSLQNSLTIAGIVVIPLAVACLVALGFAVPFPPAIGFGLLVPLWFIVGKTNKYAKSKAALYLFGGLCSALLVVAGFFLAYTLKPRTQLQVVVPPNKSSASTESPSTTGDSSRAPAISKPQNGPRNRPKRATTASIPTAPPKATVSDAPVPPIATINNCPNGICISGGTVTNPSVYNAPPEPNLTWKADAAPIREGKAGVIITLSVDHTMEVPAFVARCDRPCQTEGASSGGVSQIYFLGAKPDNPLVTGFSFIIPRPLGAGLPVAWTIRSANGDPIHIDKVVKLSPNQVPPPPSN